MIARFRIQQPIVAVTPDENVKRQLGLVFGVYPLKVDYIRQEDRIASVVDSLHSMNLITDDDTILFTAAFRTAAKHTSNLIEIHKIKELRSYR